MSKQRVTDGGAGEGVLYAAIRDIYLHPEQHKSISANQSKAATDEERLTRRDCRGATDEERLPRSD